MRKTMEQVMPKISVIIPVYNCEDYIEECLLSVLKQTIYPKEIICVNDGSTDKSRIILKKIANGHPEIIVIDQENRGAGSARNNGLAIAKGEYVAFLDGDDLFLDEDALDTMYKICKKNGLQACRALKNNINGSVYKREQYYIELLGTANLFTVLNYKICQDDYDYMCYIYNRNLLNNYNIKFPIYKRFQDPPFMVRALYSAEKFAIVNKWLYSYREPRTILRFDSKKVADMLDGIIDNYSFALEHDLDILCDRSLDHVEYEYYDVINKFAAVEPCILKKLLFIDEMKKEGGHKDILRPLAYIMNSTAKQNALYSDELIGNVKQHPYIYIYGAGHFGNIFLRFLKRNGLKHKVKEFIISEKYAAGEVDDINIRSISDMDEKEVPIFIATAGLDQKEISEQLMNNGYKNIELLNTVFLDELGQEDE